jgi:hypothetical protein
MRPDWFRSLRLPIFAGGLLLLAGCAMPATTVATPPQPAPPIPEEVIPLPPVSEQPLIWRPGFWEWSGADYNWYAGEWEYRAGHGTGWQDGYWALQGGTWVWMQAHWL